jgi:glycerophosphoryl diester phosphodiesterase
VIEKIALLMSTLATAPTNQPIEVQGHRGARSVFPENTIAAFDYALSIGVDVIELDVGVSKDDRLVVAHDPLINPELCLDPSGGRVQGKIPLRGLTLAEIKRYDCGTLPHPRFPKQKKMKAEMPSLEEVFDLVIGSKHPAAKTVRLNIETKSVPSHPELAPPPDVFARLVVDAIDRRHFGDRVVVQAFDHRVLRSVKKIAPKITTATLSGDVFPDYVGMAKSAGVRIVSPNLLWLDSDSVAEIHRAGLRVIPWTANTEDEWSMLIGFGVDGIITDDPEALIAFLRTRGRRP